MLYFFLSFLFFCFCFVSLHFFPKIQREECKPHTCNPAPFLIRQCIRDFHCNHEDLSTYLYRLKSHGVKLTTCQLVALFQWYTLCSGLIKLWLIYTIIVIKHRFKHSCIYSYTRLITIDKKFKHHTLWVCLKSFFLCSEL